MNYPVPRLIRGGLLVGAVCVLASCGSTDEESLQTGGASGVGGGFSTDSARATGGQSSHEGMGGAVTEAGALGGASMVDASVGGSGGQALPSGGASMGGARSSGGPSGGTATGGASSGGTDVGQASTGGMSTSPVLTGGATTDGAHTGGTSMGGAASGGALPGGGVGGGTGAVVTGGASSGDTGDGGTHGAEVGGAWTGGTQGVETGGTSTGGTQSAETGGASLGGTSDGGTQGIESGGSSTGGGDDDATGGTAGGEFELAWEDPFDTLDLSRWELMTHSWDGNLAQFTSENASASGGILSLSLTSSSDAAKPYHGVEMRSRETLTYGKVEASVRFAAGSAVVSSLVLIYTPWPPDDWNELDIECLGKNTDRVQFNHMINIPPADPETGHSQFPQLVTLSFNPTADFHTFAIEWVPGEARFIVDGTLMHTATQEMARMVLPQNILLTIWASDSAAWAGPVDSSTAPTSVEYDWIRVYRYVE